ncbi:carboxymuconolactone decarboxylase family protein [Peribacillus sp. NPDC097675]|uniref:carboxymuconolactone decarboxylase family protein n=1 Tax=Peribacillus sp. NPDC097675 TaxID=3390618 RepID=UPI003D015316
MPRIKKSEIGSSPFQQLFHNQLISNKWSDLSEEISSDGALTKELKENVRRVLAYGNGCTYCQGKGRPLITEDIKESYAMAFAEVFLTQREKIEATFFVILKEVFSDEEISELVAFICFTTAQQYFGAMLGLK